MAFKKQLLLFKLKLVLQYLFVIILLGAILSGLYFSDLGPRLRATNYFKPAICNILDKKLEKGFSSRHSTSRPNFLVSYKVQNKIYQIWTYDNAKGYSSLRAENEAILNKFKIGYSYPCWYDPDKPENAVLKKGFEQLSPDDYMTLGVIAVFFIFLCLMLFQFILVCLTFFLPLNFMNNRITALMLEGKAKPTSNDEKPTIPPINLKMGDSDLGLLSRLKKNSQNSIQPPYKKSPSILGLLCGSFAIIFFLSQVHNVAPTFLGTQPGFVNTQCLIKEKRLLAQQQQDQEVQKRYVPDFLLSYNVGGKQYDSNYKVPSSISNDEKSGEVILSQYVVGHKYSCGYDPNKPEIAVLNQPNSWGIPLLIFFIGGPLLVLTLIVIQLIKKLRNLSNLKIS